MTQIVVQKYGGSSLADTARIRRVAERIAQTRRAGKQVCVVVSAQYIVWLSGLHAKPLDTVMPSALRVS